MNNGVSVLLDAIGPYRSVSIMGMSKNTGKTTVLNALIGGFRYKGETIALTSIGRDGEKTDIVTGTGKPEIYIHDGTLFATAKKLLALCDVTKEYLLSTGIETPLGEIVAVKAQSGGYVQIGGPSTNAGLEEVRDAFFRLGADRVIIDGAVGRKSQTSGSVCDCCILCTGAALDGSMARVIEETAFICDIYDTTAISDERAVSILKEKNKSESLVFINDDYSCNTAKLDTNLGSANVIAENIEANVKYLYIGGAVVDSAVSGIISAKREGLSVIAGDAAKILISRECYFKLKILGTEFHVINGVKLAAVCINPVSPRGLNFNSGEFKRRLAAAINKPVINVREGEGA